jgi:sugar phosphate isomerase/epimerase
MFANRTDRRQFVRQTALGLLAAPLASRIALADDVIGTPSAGKIGDFKISLAEWSLHKRLFGSSDVPKANLEFPRMAKEEFNIDGVEFVNQFFKDKARDETYLKELKKRSNDLGVTCVLIMIDGEGDMSAPEKQDRAKAVENHKRWVDAAKDLGCHSIRINTGEHYSPSDVGACADACRQLVEYGDKSQINIICENHGGPSSWPDALLALMKAVDHPRFGTLPDFGNFPPRTRGAADGPKTVDLYDAIARMMKYAKGVSAKCYEFSADGRESSLDFPRLMKIVSDAGYRGFVGIEYEGAGPEPEGIIAARKLLETLRGSMYTP